LFHAELWLARTRSATAANIRAGQERGTPMPRGGPARPARHRSAALRFMDRTRQRPARRRCVSPEGDSADPSNESVRRRRAVRV